MHRNIRKNTAAAIPAAVAFIPPVKIPRKPTSFTSSITPFDNEYPNPEMGTVAPAFPKSTICWYIPSPVSIAPAVTNTTRILAGVNLVLSINI